MAVEFWNQQGRPVAYIDDDDQSIYLWDGSPVAWIDGDAIYSYSVRFLGWLWDGWVRNLDGDCVFFTEFASGGPVRPVHPRAQKRSCLYFRPEQLNPASDRTVGR